MKLRRSLREQDSRISATGNNNETDEKEDNSSVGSEGDDENPRKNNLGPKLSYRKSKNLQDNSNFNRTKFNIDLTRNFFNGSSIDEHESQRNNEYPESFNRDRFESERYTIEFEQQNLSQFTQLDNKYKDLHRITINKLINEKNILIFFFTRQHY